MKNSSWIPILSLIIAALTGYLVFSHMQEKTNLMSIPALVAKVAPGTKITTELVTSIQMDEPTVTNSVMPVLTSPDQIIGKIAYTHFLENTPILFSLAVSTSPIILAIETVFGLLYHRTYFSNEFCYLVTSHVIIHAINLDPRSVDVNSDRR
jgi:hypothetical protein